MTTSRIGAVAIALSIAFGFVGGAGSTQGSAKDQNLSGTIASSKRMADGKEWTTANLNVNTSSSYCYDDSEPNCRRYGRLYTWESARRGCQSLVGLLDVNVLVALLVPEHEHHPAAMSWFASQAGQGWATCGVTEARDSRLR